MRLRLLMDVEIDDNDIGTLADLIAEQVGATVQIDGYRPLGARFMGAKPVEVGTHPSEPGNHE